MTRRAPPGVNVDRLVVDGFGDEWRRFDQTVVDPEEAQELFGAYFSIFPWSELPSKPRGFDAGCGSGRWARLVAPRVHTLHCVDASRDALQIAQRALAGMGNCEFHHATLDSMPLAENTADFGYSLGVLHHIPDTLSALRACVGKLKPGAPFLVYVYYAFDNRPIWFRMIWRISDRVRALVSRCPFAVRSAIADVLAVIVYVPLARTAKLAERLRMPVDSMPLAAYRNRSLYVMRTDSLDRFGTRLEHRFTREQIEAMMTAAGLERIRFSGHAPYWCALGYKQVGQ